jgi:pullulanase/glycogen debranching enzyme
VTPGASSGATVDRRPALPTGWSVAPKIFGHEAREPEQSVNFVTCHDGLALNGLVSYNCKRNEANGDYDRDGAGRARGNRRSSLN